jgi:hypothetical protein
MAQATLWALEQARSFPLDHTRIRHAMVGLRARYPGHTERWEREIICAAWDHISVPIVGAMIAEDSPAVATGPSAADVQGEPVSVEIWQADDAGSEEL